MTTESPSTAVSRFGVRVFAWVLLLCGIGAVGLSHTFLISDDVLQIVGGSIELLAGIGLVAVSLLASFPPRHLPSSEADRHSLGCLKAAVPGAVAAGSWLIIFFTGGILALLVMPIVLLFCIIWAWNLSPRVTLHFLALVGWKYPARTRALVFTFQVFTILATWLAFGHFLQLLEWMGLLHIPFSA